MIDLSFLSKSEVEHLDEQIGFTDIEKEIIEHLVKSDLTDDGIMLELHLSRNKYYKIKAQCRLQDSTVCRQQLNITSF